MIVMMRVDYRWLRVVSVPLFLVGIVALVLVFVPGLNVVVGGSARWLKIGPLPAVHPAEFMKLALVIYLAHWFAKRGSAVRGFWTGTVPFLVIAGPVVVLVLLEPDMGTSIVLAAHGLHDVLPRGRQRAPPGRAGRRRRARRGRACSCAATRWTGSRPG